MYVVISVLRLCGDLYFIFLKIRKQSVNTCSCIVTSVYINDECNILSIGSGDIVIIDFHSPESEHLFPPIFWHNYKEHQKRKRNLGNFYFLYEKS